MSKLIIFIVVSIVFALSPLLVHAETRGTSAALVYLMKSPEATEVTLNVDFLISRDGRFSVHSVMRAVNPLLVKAVTKYPLEYPVILEGKRIGDKLVFKMQFLPTTFYQKGDILHPQPTAIRFFGGVFGEDVEIEFFDGATFEWRDPMSGVHGHWTLRIRDTSESSEEPKEDCVAAILSVVPKNLRLAAEDSVPRIMQAAENAGITDLAQLAYILTTAQHESRLGATMIERAPKVANEQNYFNGKYNGRGRLGNHPDSDDGYMYRGRGYVQLTGRHNYTIWSERIGVDIVKNPDLVGSDHEIAARILVEGMRDGSFTGRSLNNYLNESGNDFFNARRIVNGITKDNRFRVMKMVKDAERYLGVLRKHISGGCN